jgi:hypothetical protein
MDGGGAQIGLEPGGGGQIQEAGRHGDYGGLRAPCTARFLPWQPVIRGGAAPGATSALAPVHPRFAQRKL